LAIEFDGKVYRFTGDKLVIENYMGFPGEKKEYENPAAQIREFLK
jgi:hypothetical protein